MTTGRGTAWITIAGLAALAAAILWARSCTSPDVAPPIGEATRDADRATERATTHLANDATRQNANAAPPTLPIESWLDHPHELAIDFRAVDPLGLPRNGERLFLAPADLPLNFAEGTTAADGHFVVRWRSRAPRVDLVASDDHGVLRIVSVAAGRPTLLTTTDGSSSVGSAVGWMAGLHPFARFSASSAIVPPSAYSGILCNINFAPSPSTSRLAERVRHPRVRAIEGFVFDENGAAAPRETVILCGADLIALATTLSNETGRFVFEEPQPGTFTVRAGGDAAGLGTATAIVTNGTTDVRIDLHRDTCIRGRVVRSDGESAASYRVAFVAEDGSWCDETWVTADGSFVLANLPTPTGDVFAFAPRRGGPPVAFALHAVAGSGDLLLRHDVAHERRMHFDVVLPDECRDANVEVRVWSIDSGLGAFVHAPKPGERWTTTPLVPGPYRVEVRAQGCGFLDLGPQWLFGDTDVDLGRVVMPRPGRVRFVIADGALVARRNENPAELWQVRPDFDVLVPVDDYFRDRVDAPASPDDLPEDGELLVPAGDYAFAYRHRDGAVRFVRFTVRGGEETVVTVP